MKEKREQKKEKGKEKGKNRQAHICDHKKGCTTCTRMITTNPPYFESTQEQSFASQCLKKRLMPYTYNESTNNITINKDVNLSKTLPIFMTFFILSLPSEV